MNNKGFTLTELLVTLVVLAIISAITIPNITGILEDNRINVAIEDANKMYETVKSLEATKKIEKPTEANACTAVTLRALDKEDNFNTTANNGTYDKDNSYVIIKKTTTVTAKGIDIIYKYYITLIEDTDGQKSGLVNVDYSLLSKNSYDEEATNYEITNIPTEICSGTPTIITN